MTALVREWEQYTRGGRPEDFNWGGFGGGGFGGGQSHAVTPEEFEQFMRGSSASPALLKRSLAKRQSRRWAGWCARYRANGGGGFDPYGGTTAAQPGSTGAGHLGRSLSAASPHPGKQ
ncbi:MAG: hypothetical protein R3E79_60335 [Caldilineaceae bacterium]